MSPPVSPLGAFHKSPLGAFYRTSLGAFGPGEAGAPPTPDKIITAAEWTFSSGTGVALLREIAPGEYNFLVVGTPPTGITGGYILTQFSLSGQFDPTWSENDWTQSAYIGRSTSVTYDPSAVTTRQAQDDPSGPQTRILYVYGGPESETVGLDTVRDQFWVLQGDIQGPGIVTIFLYSNTGEWPATIHPAWEGTEDIGVIRAGLP